MIYVTIPATIVCNKQTVIQAPHAINCVSQWGVTKTDGLSNTLGVQKGQRAVKASYRDIYVSL